MGKAELRIEIDQSLLRRAREAGLDLDALTERAVLESLGSAEGSDAAAAWAKRNQAALEAHRERIETFGVFAEDLRSW